MYVARHPRVFKFRLRTPGSLSPILYPFPRILVTNRDRIAGKTEPAYVCLINIGTSFGVPRRWMRNGQTRHFFILSLSIKVAPTPLLCVVLPSSKMSLFTSSFVRSVAIAFSLLINFSRAYSNITEELGPLLSPNAAIIFPGSAQFLVATDRDNEQDPPTFAVVVEVATESDVQETVSLCF